MRTAKTRSNQLLFHEFNNKDQTSARVDNTVLRVEKKEQRKMKTIHGVEICEQNHYSIEITYTCGRVVTIDYGPIKSKSNKNYIMFIKDYSELLDNIRSCPDDDAT